MLSLNAVSASEKDYGNLTEITLKKGLNNYQSKLVAKGLADELKQIFNFWLTESHFIYYPQCSNEENNACRQNLSFNVNFSSASVDLDNDEIDDLLVRIEHENVCGAGDCLVVDILLGGDIVGIRAGTFGPRKIYISDKTKHGLKYIFFEAGCSPKFKPEVCNFLMLEPTSPNSYSDEIVVEKGISVEY